MTSDLARQIAAQAWCTPETSGIEMDTRLAESFAALLQDVLDEAKASVMRSYRTSDAR